MQVQLVLLLCLLFSFTAHAADDLSKIKQVFSNYEQVLSKGNKTLVPQVFSAKYLKDRGGEEAVKGKLEKVPVAPYDLDVQPGAMDPNVKLVKLMPKGSKQKPDNIFILKRQPSGDWRIDGTMTNED